MRKLFGRGGADQSAPAPPKTRGLSGTAFTSAAVLCIALFVSVLGSIVTYGRVNAAYARQNSISQAQEQLQICMRDQVDQESALRGFLASGQRLFLEPYYRAGPYFTRHVDELQRTLETASLRDSSALALDLRRSHTNWEKEVAQPLIFHPSAPGGAEPL